MSVKHLQQLGVVGYPSAQAFKGYAVHGELNGLAFIVLAPDRAAVERLIDKLVPTHPPLLQEHIHQALIVSPDVVRTTAIPFNEPARAL